MGLTECISVSAPGTVTRTFALAMAAALLLGCDDDGIRFSDEIGDSGDSHDEGGLADTDAGAELNAGTDAVGRVRLNGIAEWADVHDVQIVDGANGIELRARNAKGQLIGRIVLEVFGTQIIVSSEYADGGFAVEAFADMNAQSYNVIYQTLEAEDLMDRAAAIENRLHPGSAPTGKWLACAAFAAAVVPNCLGAWAVFTCIPTTFVAGCKCTKAALDLPNEKAGLCENV